MKLQLLILTAIVSLSFLSMSSAQSQKTIIKGKVLNWPTDTVYLQTMPFYSPFKSELISQNLNKDSTFYFELQNKDTPWVIQVLSNKDIAKSNKEQLLLLNYTNDYYYGHCIKFYTYSANTFLLETGKTLDIILESNRVLEKLNPEMIESYRKAGAKIINNNAIEQINETKITFLGEETFQYKYFQQTFDLEDKVDKRLELYQKEPVEKAIESYTKIKKKLLDNLEAEKKNLSAIFYEYIKAEVEFGARCEFLKYLMFPSEEEKESLNSFFANEIPKEIIDIIEFNKDGVTPFVKVSEAYNKYLELSLNFKINVQNKKFSAFNEFSKQKCKTAIRELPKESVYYYIAGQLLQTTRTEDFIEDLLISTIKEFPNGELNEELKKKYDL